MLPIVQDAEGFPQVEEAEEIELKVWAGSTVLYRRD